MENVISFIHEFKGYDIHPSCCLIKIISEKEHHLICFIDNNNGTSVTNASEQLASEIVEKMGYDPINCRFFETYSQYDYDTFDEITYEWSYVSDTDHLGDEYYMFKAKKPQWKPALDAIKELFLTKF